MPDKGWLKAVLEEARKDVNARPEWQKNRVHSPQERSDQPEIVEPEQIDRKQQA